MTIHSRDVAIKRSNRIRMKLKDYALKIDGLRHREWEDLEQSEDEKLKIIAKTLWDMAKKREGTY